MQTIYSYVPSGITAPEKVRPKFTVETLTSASELRSDVPSSGQSSVTTFTIGQPIEQRSLEEQVFFALADAKIWTSRIAWHLDQNARNRVFRQLDVLHDMDEWAEGDRPVNLDAYKSFVRAIVYHQINSRPALSLMPNGNILGMWRDRDDTLTIEFLPGNRTRWLVQNSTADGPERVTGTSPLERLRSVLQPFGAERWFDGC